MHCIQLLRFLIDFEFIEVENDSQVFPMSAKHRCDHLIQNTQMIQELKDDYQTMIINQQSHDSIDERFSVLAIFYKKFFEQFIQRSIAPFEINIGHDLRQNLTQHYQMIISRQQHGKNIYLTREEFINTIWEAIRNASVEIRVIVEFSFQRFRLKREM